MIFRYIQLTCASNARRSPGSSSTTPSASPCVARTRWRSRPTSPSIAAAPRVSDVRKTSQGDGDKGETTENPGKIDVFFFGENPGKMMRNLGTSGEWMWIAVNIVIGWSWVYSGDILGDSGLLRWDMQWAFRWERKNGFVSKYGEQLKMTVRQCWSSCSLLKLHFLSVRSPLGHTQRKSLKRRTYVHVFIEQPFENRNIIS